MSRRGSLSGVEEKDISASFCDFRAISVSDRESDRGNEAVGILGTGLGNRQHSMDVFLVNTEILKPPHSSI